VPLEVKLAQCVDVDDPERGRSLGIAEEGEVTALTQLPGTE
jgi:hypothetical protein